MKTPRESPEDRRRRAVAMVRTIRKEFPGATTALHHADPFQLLVATVLSAQCTDERVNMVTPGLFARFSTPSDFARVEQQELEAEIKSTGFFRMKAKNIIGCSRALVERFGGQVPQTMEELVTLPGVGRKTANVVLEYAFGVVSGIIVDTHVHRLSLRMGFSKEKTPEKIEVDLMELFPKAYWVDVGTLLVLFGRKTCNARKPKCEACSVAGRCPKVGV
jgi:endonuclease III